MSALQPVHRTCENCHQPYTVTVEEQLFFKRLAEQKGGDWHLPRRCAPCRARARREREAVASATPDGWYSFTCVDCQAPFRIGPKDVVYYQERGFRWPRRCKGCRSDHRKWREANRIGEMR